MRISSWTVTMFLVFACVCFASAKPVPAPGVSPFLALGILGLNTYGMFSATRGAIKGAVKVGSTIKKGLKGITNLIIDKSSEEVESKADRFGPFPGYYGAMPFGMSYYGMNPYGGAGIQYRNGLLSSVLSPNPDDSTARYLAKVGLNILLGRRR